MTATVRRLLVAVLGLVAVGQAVAQDRGMDRLQALSSALQAHPSWRSSYHQEYIPAGMSSGDEVDGVAWVSWPDRARFDEGQPWIRSMGLKGRSVRLVDLEVGTCDEHELDDQEWARVPLAAVLDPAGAVEHFTVLELGDRGLALEPREPGGVARVEVELDDRNLPVAVEVIDPQGSLNRIRFSGWAEDPGLEATWWLPSPPADVPCIGDDADWG
jgi:hypothetical protein